MQVDVIVVSVLPGRIWIQTLHSNRPVYSQNLARVRKTVKTASAGIPGAGRPVVEFSNDGRTHTEGPAGRHYEQERSRAGCHLFFNAFWLVSNFCLFQMYMRDSLHQIDHGVIIHVLRGILRFFYGNNTL